jgi:glyoxylase-like metal-dependent hydrolase (beta-lactamase superfamily II)
MSTGTLGYDVFVADPIPMNVPGTIPNGERHMFSPLATTLIYGDTDAVLAEAPLTTGQGNAVGDWIDANGKSLTHIFASHGHGDHWFTAGMLADRFGAQIVASPGTIEEMHANVATREALWDKLWPGQIPPTPVTAVTVPGNRFTLEGHDLDIVEAGHADTDSCSVLHVPDLDLVVAGDTIYNGVHQFLGESASGGRDAWRRAIDTVEALEPRSVVASHKDKDLDDDAGRVTTETRQYLDDADDQLTKNTTAVDFFNAMLERYPNRRLGATTLWAGTNALYAHTGNEAQDSLVGWFQPLLPEARPQPGRPDHSQDGHAGNSGVRFTGLLRRCHGR